MPSHRENNIFKSISLAGVREEMPAAEQKSVIVSNQLSVSLLFIMLSIHVMVGFLGYLPPLTLANLPVILLQILGISSVLLIPVMNKKGHTNLSAFLLSVLTPVDTLVFSALFKLEMEGVGLVFYIFPRMLILAEVILPFILLGYRKKGLLSLSVLVNLACILLHDPFHNLLGVGPGQVGLGESSLESLNYFILIPFMLIILAMMFSSHVNVTYEKKLTGVMEELKDSNELLKSQNEEIEAQKELMQEQNNEIQLQKKEITDSIDYAYRIQKAILPPEYFIKKCLPDSFIFYKPKDVVSGDFYYVEDLDDQVVFSAVDCTGHGVPGAMMSVIGYNLLNHAVKLNNLDNPAEILSFLDNGVTETLRQFGDESGVKDGMDLSLCVLNKKTKELQFAGAYNSLVYVKGEELHEIKGDKLPIGVNFDGIVDVYTNHVIQLEKGDCVYMYSDGYADQFGGPKDKKFKYKQLKELLLANKSKSMQEQLNILAYTMRDWMRGVDQIDDMVIMGIRV